MLSKSTAIPPPTSRWKVKADTPTSALAPSVSAKWRPSSYMNPPPGPSSTGPAAAVSTQATGCAGSVPQLFRCGSETTWRIVPTPSAPLT